MMRAPSVKIMRRVLIGVIILTLGALLFNYLQSWYRRSRQVTKTPQILDPEMKRSAKDVFYSEYRGTPRVLRFKIHANLLLEPQSGKNLLEGIEAYDFNPDGSVRNLIRSQKAEYDPERKLADFFGDVRLSIGKKVELQTNSLHYDLNSGIGTSPDSLRIQSEQVRGTARGIRFDQKQQSLALNSEVDLTLEQRPQLNKDGAKPRTLHATAERAYCSELTDRILLEGNARIDSNPQTLSGEKIEAVFDPEGKRVRSLTATGNAIYDSKGDEDARTLAGDQLIFGIGKSGTLEKINLLGQARFSSKSSSEEQDLRGGEIEVSLDAGERPTQIKARTAVLFHMKREKETIAISGHQLDAGFVSGTKCLETILVRNNPDTRVQAKMSVETADSAGSELQADEIRMSLHESGGRSVLEKLRAEGSAQYISKPAGSNGGDAEPIRSMRAALLEMSQSGKGNFIESGSAAGNVVIREEVKNPSSRPQMKLLSADHARFKFFPEGNALKNLDADGHVQIAYEKKGSGKSSSVEQFRTASENMSAVFDLQSGKSVPRSAVQWGKFTYDDGARSASSGKCDYDAGKAILVLTESPKISDETKNTIGDRVEYDQNLKVLSVLGNVRSVLNSASGKGSLFGSSSPSPVGVKADEMRYWTESGRIRYSRKVQVQSENQYLTADVLDISDGLDRVDAQGSVRHLLSQKEPPNKAAKDKAKGPQTSADLQTTVRSTAMTYSKAKNQISYIGKVTLHSRELDLASDNLDAVPDSEGKSLQQATARGNVVMHMGERVCKGDIAQYYADSGKVVVTGNPVEVFDPAKGRSSARRLTSSTADDTILLER
jgi:LPS export ABC transporter protein LptC